jgi:hypothetical protein
MRWGEGEGINNMINNKIILNWKMANNKTNNKMITMRRMANNHTNKRPTHRGS